VTQIASGAEGKTNVLVQDTYALEEVPCVGRLRPASLGKLIVILPR
jgi:hypothetical protein